MSESGESDTSSESYQRSRKTSGKGSHSDSDGGRDSDSEGNPVDQEGQFEDEPDSEQADDAQETLAQLEEDIEEDQEAADSPGVDIEDGENSEGAPVAGGGGGSPGPDSDELSDRINEVFDTEEGTDSSTGDGSDLEQHIGASNEDVANFAQNTFSEGAVDQKHRDGAGEITAFPPEEPSHPDRVGGWDEFDSEDVVYQSPLGEGGWTSSLMTVAEVQDPETGEETIAFVTDYARNDPFLKDESRAEWTKGSEMQKNSQMSLYAYCEAMGIKGPDLTYHKDREFVVSKEIDADGEVVGTDDIADKPAKYADRAAQVDENDLEDMLAAHMLAGNWDVKYDNVSINESGSVHIFDYDRMERYWTGPDSLENTAQKHVPEVVQNINRGRVKAGEEPINVNKESVRERAVEIANDLKETGHDEVVEEALEMYDDPMRSTQAEQFRNNVDNLADDNA